MLLYFIWNLPHRYCEEWDPCAAVLYYERLRRVERRNIVRRCLLRCKRRCELVEHRLGCCAFYLVIGAMKRWFGSLIGLNFILTLALLSMTAPQLGCWWLMPATDLGVGGFTTWQQHPQRLYYILQPYNVLNRIGGMCCWESASVWMKIRKVHAWRLVCLAW